MTRKVWLFLLLIGLTELQVHVAFPARADSPTPTLSPIKSLPFGQNIRGTIYRKGGSTRYTINSAKDQDIVVTLKTDRRVDAEICERGTTPDPKGAISGGDCAKDDGGTRDDAPMSRIWFLPVSGAASQTLHKITLSRDSDIAANYTITAYTLTPKSTKLGATETGTLSFNMPFRVYTFDGQSADFVTTILQEPRGAFLWVNRLFTNTDPALQNKHQDVAQQDINNSGIFCLELRYSNLGHKFHVLVGAVGNYSLTSSQTPQTKEWREQTMNYLTPAMIGYVSPLSIHDSVNLAVVSGAGLSVSLVQKDLALKTKIFPAMDSYNDLTFTEVKLALDRTPTYIVFQLPVNATREAVKFQWQYIVPASLRK